MSRVVGFLLSVHMKIAACEAMGVDAIAERIKTVSGTLDRLGYAPTVRTLGLGEDVTLTVDLVMPTGDLHTFGQGVSTIIAAMEVAGLNGSAATIRRATFHPVELN